MRHRVRFYRQGTPDGVQDGKLHNEHPVTGITRITGRTPLGVSFP